MGRKKAMPKPTPAPVQPKDKKDRKIVFKQGNWTVLKNGVGFTKSKFRATFADDSDGCYGHGMTQEEAVASLHYYEKL